jgi:hypothetical protein
MGVLVWLFAATGTQGEFSLPDGAEISSFDLTTGFDLSVRNSTLVLWGPISYPGSALTFRDTAFLVAGLLFSGDTQQTLSGIENNGPIPDLSGLQDRGLTFENSSVKTWNFYVADTSRLTVDACLFGEVLSFHNAVVTVGNSTCDGTGGFVGTNESSHMEIRDSTLDSDVTTFGTSTLLLERCSVIGDIRATGESTVTLRQTTVDGGKFEFDQGKIVEE